MTSPEIQMPYAHYFEPIEGEAQLGVVPRYETPDSYDPTRLLLLPTGSQSLIITWQGVEEVRLSMSNFWTAVGARHYRAGTIPAGTRGQMRRITLQATSPQRQYLSAHFPAAPSTGTLQDQFKLEVLVLPMT